MPKPTDLAIWATDTNYPSTSDPIKIAPSAGVKAAGWAGDQKPSAQRLNWWMNAVYNWVVWLDAFESTVHTWTALQTLQAGITVTQSAANTTGVRSTGNGTADGVWGTGGASDGTGVFGQGGATNGKGVQGTGAGSGAGVTGNGGSSGGRGVVGIGNGTAPGVHGTGGGTSAAGVHGVGGASNGLGVLGEGDGTGAGVSGIGGDSDGPGVLGTGKTGGIGTGVKGVGGDGGGYGVEGESGLGVGGKFVGLTGAVFEGSTGAAIILADGSLKINSVPPARADANQANVVHKNNKTAAWAYIQLNTSANPTVHAGANINTVTISGMNIVFTFPTGGAMATNTYGVQTTVGVSGPTGNKDCRPSSLGTTSFSLQLFVAGAVVDPALAAQNNQEIWVEIVGVQ
jgi:hypothetical protein